MKCSDDLMILIYKVLDLRGQGLTSEMEIIISSYLLGSILPEI
jgi:hypothetical protein